MVNENKSLQIAILGAILANNWTPYLTKLPQI